MIPFEYANYAWEQTAALLAVDSPSGFTERAALWVKNAFAGLGFPAEITVKGGVLADLGGQDSCDGLLLEAHADTLGGMVSQIKSTGCLKITNLDPIKYQLLFERFLNPDRISMPDIDVDFEDLGAAHKYVEDHYGLNHVSRVITFGTMAAKSAIKDVARISNLSIEESNRLTKMVPDRLSEMKEKEYPFNPKLDELKKGFKQVSRMVEVDDPDNPGQKKSVEKFYQVGMEEVDAKINLKNCYRLVPEFQEELKNGTEINKEVLFYADERIKSGNYKSV